jgi:UPF0755 protein
MRVLNFLVAIAVLIVVLMGALGYLYLNPLDHDPNVKVVVDVAPGKSYSQVIQELVDKDVLTSAQKFRLLIKLLGRSQHLKVGEYELEYHQPPIKVLEVITSGKSLLRQITIPEGYNMYEVADLLETAGLGRKEEALLLFQDRQFVQELVGEPVDSLEGYLFPETYTYTKYTPLRSFIKQMTDLFHKVYAEVSAGRKAPLTRHQMVTLASIIEKETAVPRERTTIASVFYNRLKKRMRLQTDPTIVYGILRETGVAPDRIRTRDIRRPTAYNTYTIFGLPPGPIANPGRASLESTFSPDGSEYLYFVSRNDGSHFFSKTYQEHNSAVQKYQIRGEKD